LTGLGDSRTLNGMAGGGKHALERSVVYCIVPRELAGKLHEPLRRHFDDDPGIEVIVERRRHERRGAEERRAATPIQRRAERRGTRSPRGRRIAEQRAAQVPVEAPELPRKARAYADRLLFVERVGPGDQHGEDVDTARLVAQIQGGDREAFGDLYLRYFDRVYNYLRVVLNDAHEAEDATQQVFVQVLEALPRYEYRQRPFRVWLFVVVRNYALGLLPKRARLDVVDGAELQRRREQRGVEEPQLDALEWVTDRELLILLERLPTAQRQILVLRYMLDLNHVEIASVLGLSHENVRVLHHRAQRFLRDRLTALGRGPRERTRARMRSWPKKAPVLRSRRFALSRPG
jgi:RNA polymerase sigma-70 factor (ECF subfamily)